MRGHRGRHIHSTPRRAEAVEALCWVLTLAADRRAPTRAVAGGSPQGAAEAPIPALPRRSVDTGVV